MHSLAQYALLGSLFAAAAGAVLLAVVTVKHGLTRRRPGHEPAPDDAARRQRAVRLADTLAVLCFAVSAGLGVLGLMENTRAVTPAVAAIDDHGLADRLQAIEKRVASAELELQSRGGSAAPEWRAWEERIARLESRLGAIEERAAVAGRRVDRPRTATPAAPRPVAPVMSAPRPAAPAQVAPAPSPAPSALPRLSPDPSVGGDLGPPPRPEASMSVAPAAPPRPEPSVPFTSTVQPKAEPSAPVAAAPQSPPPASAPAGVRESTRPRANPPAADVSVGDRLGGDWETIKRQARRGGDDWREGWDQLKRLFGY